jgi:DUF1365 family protein
MHSALYLCNVWHSRTEPVVHRFATKMAWFYLDLDELSVLDDSLRLFSVERWNWFTWRDEDHLPSGAGNLKARALRQFADACPHAAEAAVRVRVMSHVRVAGYVFNPVSFFFFFDAAEHCLGALAEVRNTFGEVKVFPVPLDLSGKPETTVTKHFYVSPFVDLDAQFHFALEVPGESFRFRVDSLAGEKALVKTGARGERAALTDTSLLKAALGFPLQTLKVISLIHWHALRLYLKKAPYLQKADKPFLQTGILSPAVSLEENRRPTTLHGVHR